MVLWSRYIKCTQISDGHQRGYAMHSMSSNDSLWLPMTTYSCAAQAHCCVNTVYILLKPTSHTASLLCKSSHRFSLLNHPESLWLPTGHHVSPDLILKLVFSTLLLMPNLQPCLAMCDNVNRFCWVRLPRHTEQNHGGLCELVQLLKEPLQQLFPHDPWVVQHFSLP